MYWPASAAAGRDPRISQSWDLLTEHERAVMQGLGTDFRAHLDYISSQLSLLSQTEDHREAATAFLEKRKPEFKGR